MIPQPSQLAFDRSSQLRDDHEVCPVLLEPSNKLAVVKTLVCPDNYALPWVGTLGKTGLEQSLDAAGSVGVARSQLPMPIVLALALETQQRMIGRSTTLYRIVADPSILLPPVNDQYGRVDIENQARRSVREIGHAPKKLIVQCSKSRQHLRRCTQQKPSEACCIRITRESCQVLKNAILSKQSRRLQTFDSQNHRIQNRQQRLANAVSIVPLFDLQLVCSFDPEANLGEEAMQQVHAAVVRQVFRTKLEHEFSGSSGRPTKSRSRWFSQNDVSAA